MNVLWILLCSAGIGRSGVFIASCLGVMSLEDSGEVDILKVVSTMRQDRGGMVQSRTQYIFLHKVCVMHFIKCVSDGTVLDVVEAHSYIC